MRNSACFAQAGEPEAALVVSAFSKYNMLNCDKGGLGRLG
jgi:hypothetical protein